MASVKGVIARLVSDKGYGFIRADITNTEYFFHRSALKNADIDELNVSQIVFFEPGNGPKGPRATNVHVEEDYR